MTARVFQKRGTSTDDARLLLCNHRSIKSDYSPRNIAYRTFFLFCIAHPSPLSWLKPLQQRFRVLRARVVSNQPLGHCRPRARASRSHFHADANTLQYVVPARLCCVQNGQKPRPAFTRCPRHCKHSVISIVQNTHRSSPIAPSLLRSL